MEPRHKRQLRIALTCGQLYNTPAYALCATITAVGTTWAPHYRSRNSLYRSAPTLCVYALTAFLPLSHSAPTHFCAHLGSLIRRHCLALGVANTANQLRVHPLKRGLHHVQLARALLSCISNANISKRQRSATVTCNYRAFEFCFSYVNALSRSSSHSHLHKLSAVGRYSLSIWSNSLIARMCGLALLKAAQAHANVDDEQTIASEQYSKIHFDDACQYATAQQTFLRESGSSTATVRPSTGPRIQLRAAPRDPCSRSL